MLVAAVAVLVASASPAAAISPAFFQSYVSGGAVVLQTGNPFGTKLLALNFRPTDFTPAQADAAFQVIWEAVTGLTSVNSLPPTTIAAIGFSPVQLLAAMEQVLQDPTTPFDKLFVLDIYRSPSSQIGIDLYQWFSPNDYRYLITFQV
jgi:hypothetical protein